MRLTCILAISMTLTCGGNVLGQAAPKPQGTDAGSWELVLSGDDWQIASFEPGQGIGRRAFAEGYPETEAIAATVPGDVHGDLERAGKIPPIFYGLNSQKIGWVAGKEWWYRKKFVVTPQWKGKTVRLRFESVDYLTEVWLNGRLLGRHEGQFTPFEYDVADSLRYDAENVLAVLIHPAPATVRAATAGGEWPMMQAMRPAYSYWKCQTNAGWDWGAKIITMGIWKDVRLLASQDVCLSTPIVLPQLTPPYNRATLNIQLNLDAKKAGPVELHYFTRCLTSPDAPVQAVQTISLQPGSQKSSFPLEINNPQLWWPNGYGRQHLYALEVTARAPGEANELGFVRTTFGIRDLKMLANPEVPDNVEYVDYATGEPVTHQLPKPAPERKYLIQINGRRIFARGSNWVPCDLLYGRTRQSSYEHLIRLAAEGNFNLFRIWGGGLIEKPIFYELCDRYGIMLFQEFPNAGTRLAETDAALAITGREAREVLPLLMNYPCIVRWGGGNEWYRDAHNSRQMAQLRTICNEVDPTRPYHDPDPETMAQRHGQYWYEHPQTYDLYNTGRPIFVGPDNPLEWTEYGFAGASSVEALKSIMPATNLWPIHDTDPYWNWHKAFNAFGADNWLGSGQYRLLFGTLPDLETTVRCSQFTQAEGLRYANQSMRRHQWHRSACTSWVYNEPWPNAAGDCMVEHFGRPKMAYYYVKQSYAPLDISAVYSSLLCKAGKPLGTEIWTLNDAQKQLDGYRWRYRVFSLHGEVWADKSQPITLSAETCAKTSSIDWTPTAEMAGQIALLWLELVDPAGKTAARNLYTFSVEKKGGPASALIADLLKAPPAALTARLGKWQQEANGEKHAILEVENPGDTPALFVKLDRKPPAAARVYFEDNYFFLPLHEGRRIRITLPSDRNAKADEDPVTLQIKAWNSEPIEIR